MRTEEVEKGRKIADLELRMSDLGSSITIAECLQGLGRNREQVT